MSARGQHVDYLIKTGAVTIRGEPEATVEQGGREIHARELTYQPDPSGRIGQFTATGQGWVRGARPREGQHFHASWTCRLYFRPYEGNYLLSLEGGVRVDIIGKGAVSAEEIYLWLRDTSPPLPAGQSQADGRQQFTPDRLQAVGHVKIDSPQLTGEVGQLQTWFETVVVPTPLAEAIPVPAAREPVPTPATTMVSTAAAAPPAGTIRFQQRRRQLRPQRPRGRSRRRRFLPHARLGRGRSGAASPPENVSAPAVQVQPAEAIGPGVTAAARRQNVCPRSMRLRCNGFISAAN